MKKIVSIVLIVCFIFQCMVFTMASLVEDYTKFYFDDNGTPGTPIQTGTGIGKFTSNGKSYLTYGVDPKNSSNKTLYSTAKTASTSYGLGDALSSPLDLSSGNIMLESKIYVEDTGALNGFYLGFLDSANVEHNIFQIKKDLIAYVPNNTVKKVITTNTWYHIMFAYNTTTEKGAIYIDGDLLQDNLNLANPQGFKDNIASMKLRVRSIGNVANKDVYAMHFDDLSVYTTTDLIASATKVTDVAIDEDITINFNHLINKTTAINSNVNVTTSGGGSIVPCTVIASEKSMLLQFDSELLPNETYSVDISKVLDIFGKSNTQNISFETVKVEIGPPADDWSAFYYTANGANGDKIIVGNSVDKFTTSSKNNYIIANDPINPENTALLFDNKSSITGLNDLIKSNMNLSGGDIVFELKVNVDNLNTLAYFVTLIAGGKESNLLKIEDTKISWHTDASKVANLIDSQWNNVVIIVDKTTFKASFYVNGVEIATNLTLTEEATLKAEASNMALRFRANPNANPYKIYFDDIKAYTTNKLEAKIDKKIDVEINEAVSITFNHTIKPNILESDIIVSKDGRAVEISSLDVKDNKLVINFTNPLEPTSTYNVDISNVSDYAKRSFVEPLSFQTIDLDLTPPDQVTNLVATALDSEVKLTWTNPSNVDFDKSELIIKENGAIIKTVMLDKEIQEYMALYLKNNVQYTFLISTIDTSLNKSNPISVECTPIEIILADDNIGFNYTADGANGDKIIVGNSVDKFTVNSKNNYTIANDPINEGNTALLFDNKSSITGFNDLVKSNMNLSGGDIIFEFKVNVENLNSLAYFITAVAGTTDSHLLEIKDTKISWYNDTTKSKALIKNSWNSIVIAIDQSTFKAAFYVNGELVADNLTLMNESGFISSLSDMSLRLRANANTNPYKIYLDDIKIYTTNKMEIVKTLETDVDVRASLDVQFNHSIKNATIPNDSIKFTNSLGEDIEIEKIVKKDDRTITIYPKNILEFSDTYTVQAYTIYDYFGRRAKNQISYETIEPCLIIEDVKINELSVGENKLTAQLNYINGLENSKSISIIIAVFKDNEQVNSMLVNGQMLANSNGTIKNREELVVNIAQTDKDKYTLKVMVWSSIYDLQPLKDVLILKVR